MADISGGSLSFTSSLDNDQLNAAIEETLRRVQGLSDAVAASGDAMDETTQEIVESIEMQKQVIKDLETTVEELNARIESIEPGDAQNALIEQANAAKQELDAEKQGMIDLLNELNNLQQSNATTAMSFSQIRAALGEIGVACETHEQAIAELQSEYDALGKKMSSAFAAGRDDEYRAINQRRTAIMGEIRVRQQLLSELQQQSNALEDEAAKIEKANQEAQESANQHVTLRTRIRELREEMALYREQFGDQTDEYRQMSEELGRLQDIQGDIQSQGKILSNDEAQFQGVISGLSGIAGGFAAAQGAVALFAGENENLQAIMLKVQSLMSITMGLQQASQALNKDSAFRLVTLNGLREYWNKLLAIGRGEQVADTAATTANTAAKNAQAAASRAGAAAQSTATAANRAGTTAQVANTAATGSQATAATAGTVANIGLAGAFRMVGAAIKSIPVFGWIAAAIAAIVAVVSSFISKANEAKKAQEEFFGSIAENAYKPIGNIEMLATQWNALGDDLEAKKKFIEENKRAFDELGVSINGVTEAENLLSDNKQAFIDAQIEKAKAMVYIQQATDKVKELVKAEQEYNAMPDKVSQYVQTSSWGTGYYVEVDNAAKAEKEAEIKEIRTVIEKGYQNAAQAEKKGLETLKNAGIEAAGTYADGTLGAIENAIANKREALKKLDNNEAYERQLKEIEGLQAQADKITGGGKKTTSSSGSTKDPFTEKLARYKSEYQRFLKWVNSGDSVLVQSANQEFQGLLAEGATYIDYLKNQREIILSVDVANRTKTQNKQLRQLNDAIAEETKATVLEAFNNELSDQLTNAQTIIDMLNIIEQRRKELSGDGTELDNAKQDALDDAEKSAKAQMETEVQKLLEEYAGYIAQKRKLEEDYNNDMALLQRKRSETTNEQELADLDAAMANRTKEFENDNKSSGDSDYDAMLEKYRTFEQQRQDIQEEYDEKIATARLHNNTELVKQLQAEQAKELLNVSFEELKVSPEYAEAFTDLGNVSTETLRSLVARFEECKLAVAGAMNVEDLQAYGEKLSSIVEELQSRDPFTTLKEGYAELRTAQKELRQAQRELQAVQQSESGTDAEIAAIQKVNTAKDKYIKANNKVKKSEKTVRDSVKQLTSELSELGDAIGGQAGEIISLIGDIGSFVLSAMDGVKTASETSSAAIQTVEKASVILAIVSAALQIATKIFNLFAGDDGMAAYERASEVYGKYVDILNDVIEKQKELIATMSGENAKNSYEYALSLIEKETNAARELGKQWLAAGASWNSRSNGVKQRRGISDAAWDEWAAFVEQTGVDYALAEGRMMGLFDLTAEQIAELRETAPLFYASLSEETQEYLNAIADSLDSAEELKDAYNEALTGVDYDSFEEDFIEMLSDMESSTEDFVENFQEYMRKALISNMFKTQFKSQLEKYYQMWADALDPDGDGGEEITDEESDALNALRDSIISGATAAAEKINEQFDTSASDEDALTGSVQSVTEETADIISGQMNAIRINQLEATDVMRQSLTAINAIAQNTAYNRYLARIERVITILETAYQSDSLRSQGLS